MFCEVDQPRGLEASSTASDSRPPVSDRRLLFIPLVILLSLAALIIVERLATYGKPLDRDITAYAVIGHEMLTGRMLYSDLFDQKPPAIYVTYAVAETIAGYGPHTLFLMSVAVGIITLLGVYFAGSSGNRGISAGLWAAAFWAITSNTLKLDAGSPNTEVFINACLIWAFALLVRAGDRFADVWRWLAIGALFALASLYKQIAVVCPILLAYIYVALPPTGSQHRRRALTQILVMAGVGVASWVMVFGYFAATGRFQAFLDSFIYNRAYAGNMFANLLAPLGLRVQLMPKFLIPLALLTGLGAMFGFAKSFRSWGLLIAFVVATYIEVALPGRFWPHYYQLWLPPLVIGAGWTIGLLRRMVTKRSYAWLPHAVGAVLLVFLSLNEVRLYRHAFVGEWLELLVDPRFAAADQLAREIDTILAPGETCYVWGDAPGLYFRTQRRPPTGVLFTTQTLVRPLDHSLSARIAADLAREQPELFIIERAGALLGQPGLFDISKGTEQPEVLINKAGHPVIDWFGEHYWPLPSNPDGEYFVVFMRRGGKVEARLECDSTHPRSTKGDYAHRSDRSQ